MAQPKPIAFTKVEGGEWIEFNNSIYGRNPPANAIKFEDGSIFDMVNGWRENTCDHPEPDREFIHGQKCGVCGEIGIDLLPPLVVVERTTIKEQTETIFPKDVADYTGHCPKCLRGPVTLAHFGHGKECEDIDK